MEATAAPRRYFTKLPRAERLLVSYGALRALAENADIRAALIPRGYNAARLTAGLALADAARATTGTQATARTLRLLATSRKEAALALATERYRPLAETAHVLFRRQPAALAALGLSGTHSKSAAERIERMRLFAQEARIPAFAAAFAAVDAPEADFDALDDALDAAQTDLYEQAEQIATSQDSTDARVAAFKALDDWMTEMQGFARIALKGRPQLLEALGVRPR